MEDLLYRDESYAIRGACFEVYKEIGHGFLEAVYQECLEKEFLSLEIPCTPKDPLVLSYKGEALKQTYVPDFVCYDKIIVEIKAVKELVAEHRAQLLNYLKATKHKLGFLVNFGHHPGIQIERIANTKNTSV